MLVFLLRVWKKTVKINNIYFLRYDEKQLLGDIESHLKITIEQIGKNINVPVNEFDGKVSTIW